MQKRPLLELFAGGCAMSRRAEISLRACRALEVLVELRVRNIDDPLVDVPPCVVGCPTLVFQGTAVALGTPDCSAVVRRVRLLLADPRRGGLE